MDISNDKLHIYRFAYDKYNRPHCFKCMYSGTPLVRPPLLRQKCGLVREVASHQGLKSTHLCSDLHCTVALQEGLTSPEGGLSEGVPLYSLYADIMPIYPGYNELE